MTGSIPAANFSYRVEESKTQNQIHFLFQRAQKVVLKSVENHKKSSLKVYFDDTNIKNSTLINRAWWQG